MAIYAVYCAAGHGEPEKALERARFLKLGFCWAALAFGPLWLIAHRLWRPLAAWLVGAALVGAAAASGFLDGAAASWLYALSALYLGAEGRALQAAALARRGRPLVDVVCAADEPSAEREFFARALARPTPPRAAAPSQPPPPPRAPPPVVGFFPEAGR